MARARGRRYTRLHAVPRVNLKRKLSWVSLLYFAEGFPFGVVFDFLPVYFRVHGVSLTDLGLMRLLNLPWTLKVLWSPLVDRLGTRQLWIASCLTIMAGLLFFMPQVDPTNPVTLLWVALLLFTVASATQDVAIDAYTIELMDKGEEGAANSVRISAYRVALIAAGGGLLMLADRAGWPITFYLAGCIMLLLAVVVSLSPRTGVRSESEPGEWFAPIIAWLKRPGAPIVFLFVLTYKLGDSAMGPMVKPFWVDSGLSLDDIALVSTTFGVFATIAGAMLGGILTTRWGLSRALLILGLLQMVSNLGYAAVAASGIGRYGIYSASMFESFTGGLGNAAFMSFMMRACDKKTAATEFALLSATFAFTRDLAGAVSGWAATHFGYAAYFTFTAFLALPAFGLLPFLHTWTDETPEAAVAS